MSAQLEVWKHVEQLVKQRAPKNFRFKKLRGAEAKTAVIKGATARLFAPDAVFPYALRKRLTPRQRVGNISWRPVDGLTWAAWRVVHRSYIERGSFWFEEQSAAKLKLIDRAVDAERKSWVDATAVAGGDAAAASANGLADTHSLPPVCRVRLLPAAAPVYPLAPGPIR